MLIKIISNFNLLKPVFLKTLNKNIKNLNGTVQKSTVCCERALKEIEKKK